MIDLRLGRWEDVLLYGEFVDAVITDPPYSPRVHDGHDEGVNFARKGVNAERREIDYSAWSAADVRAFVDAWAPRNTGWFVCLSDNELCPAYRDAFEANGLTGFAPVGILIPGMTVRMAGDGPSSWMLYANVARPKRLSKWGTLPGGYTENRRAIGAEVDPATYSVAKKRIARGYTPSLFGDAKRAG